MTRNLLLSALLGCSLFVATSNADNGDPQKSAPKASTGDVQDFVLLAPHRPMLIRLHLQVNGKPYRKAWDEFFDFLFTRLDSNKDGKLDEKEQQRIPNPVQLFSSTNIYYQTVVVSQPASWKGKKITKEELIGYYQTQGASSFRVMNGSNPQILTYSGRGPGYVGPMVPAVSADKVSRACFELLDTDRDGVLSLEELKTADRKLLRRDFDEDEILMLSEVLGNLTLGQSIYRLTRLTGRMGRQRTAMGNLVVPVTTNKPSKALALRLIKTYTRANKAKATSLKLSELDVGKKELIRLDVNSDGTLSRDELATFAMRTPDQEMSLDLGAKAKVNPVPQQSSRDRRIALPQGVTVRMEKSVKVQGANLRFSVGGNATNGTVVYTTTPQYHQAVFQQVDRDKNGYLDEKEAKLNYLYSNVFSVIDADGDKKLFLKEIQSYYKEWGELQSKAQLATVSLSVFEEGQGFFSLLDANKDQRLTIREMRAAPGLLKTLDGNKDGKLSRGEIPISYHLSVAQGSSATNNYWYAPTVVQPNVGIAPRGVAQPNPTNGIQIPMWFTKMDRNRDYDVSRREFMGTKKMFLALDKDRDGLISVKEASEAEQAYRADKRTE